MTKRLNRRQFVRKTAIASTLAGMTIAGTWTFRDAEAAAEGEYGDLIGKLVYDGEAPERKKLKVDKDVDCCGKFDIRDETLMVGEDGGLANVYIYCRSRRVKICPDLEKDLPKNVVLDNRDCIFKPHCLKIWISKQEFSIVNSDPVAQNVAFSPLGDLAANIVLPPPPDKASKATWNFNRPQRLPVRILCNYHPWEVGYILPIDHPYVAITKPDGTFRIPKLPAGKKLEFQVWQERCGYVATDAWKKGRFEIEIKPEENDLGTIKLAPKLFEKK